MTDSHNAGNLGSQVEEMAYQWFRLYAEFATDPVVQSLSFDDQRHFVMVLCMKCSGLLDREYGDPQQRLTMLRRTLGLEALSFDEAKNRLVSARLIDAEWQPRNWNKRQFLSDKDPTAKDRKRRQRERSRTSHYQVTDESRMSHAPQNQNQNTESEKTKNTTAAPRPDDARWLKFKATFPARAGGQPWSRAQKAINGRLREGGTWEEIQAGAERYAEFIVATGKLNTEYVMQAATFVGPDKHFLQPWAAPAVPESNHERFQKALSRYVNGDHEVIEHEPEPIKIPRW